MKLIICLLSLALACQAISDEEVLQKWQNYQKDFGKTYRSPVEHRHRFALFKQKLLEIEEHNKLYNEGKVTWYKGVTPFSDWTAEEFETYVNKYKFDGMLSDAQMFKGENLTVPESLDWRLYGVVTDVKNQGSCGSCWTFSSTGALEGANRLTYGPLLPLSEQNLLDCATEDYGSYGCRGGNFIGAFTYVRYHGIASEESYPYTQVQGTCQSFTPVLKATGYKSVSTEDDLLKAVGNIGPVAVAIYSTANLQDYSGGILDDNLCSGSAVNHGVLVVGYGSENGVDFWIVKNSWGASWGESGYWRMIRGKNSCNVGSYGVYPTV